MIEPKLSPAQTKVLLALSEPGEYAHYMKDMGMFSNSYWFLHLTFGHIRAVTMRRLVMLGFVMVKKDSSGYPDIATITPAGREYLKGLQSSSLT